MRVQNLMGSGAAAQLASNIAGTMLNSIALTATGSTQATGLLLVDDINIFTTVAASTGAVLPTVWNFKDSIEVFNNGANALSLYPSVGGQIGTASVNAALSIPAGKGVKLITLGSNNWVYNLSA